MVGLIPEIKNAMHFRWLGFASQDPFLHTVAAHEYSLLCPLAVRSFEIILLQGLCGRHQAINL
ncbi:MULTISPECIES: hypothetical protein [Komagataeibacter]|uniref:Uncharacterized protein n=2 Tax=Acetobacteraceae TaxID=433 RepID=A0A2V4S9F1_9PROT|nr:MULTISPECIES: hypothetical protein [Komagataeibacter]AHI27395.1 glycerophosphoryl diester phosphodiesterase [Komagataeibacter xylinus E25]AZV40476.1 hypothetical protein CXP35_16165 [Komagataeibacter xylinus]PYD68638.1 hypothetical protein CFR76_14120 [Komagataeibacter swingsii]RFO99901.1 hypothetical protein BGC31_10630 [Komagataeibacter xylinus]RFO99922.1 hypothetical protein BFX83_01105 [Komagataeibacter xylinus]